MDEQLKARLRNCPTPSKRKFFTRKQAKRYALYLESAFLKHGNKRIRNVPYHCRCGMWHLTSRKPKK